MKIARPYLVFFNPIYWLVTTLRTIFYNLGLFRSTSFNHPIIVLGNLSVGGTGKTPHTEYLVRLLKDKHTLAVLSRGYGRQSRGFQEAGPFALAALVGDEPAQIKNKFGDVTVVVDANRVQGVQTLLTRKPPPEVILLDDAFQHRKLAAGLYILLTPYHQPYVHDVLLPAGNLRESRAGAGRAHIIIITKCPETLSDAQMHAVVQELKPQPHQQVFFTGISYGEPIGALATLADTPFLLVTGIADAKPLLLYLCKKGARFFHRNFADHHIFTTDEVGSLIAQAKREGVQHILTTEKDFQRLPIDAFTSAGLQVSFLPIQVTFLGHEAAFQRSIQSFISSFST